MGDLEPITRNEKLWSGEDLEPMTRREMYIRHLYDETQVIPDSPKTREEMFILKAGEELHDVTIEQLTATENGTYSEEGVAYSPVIVEVPEPTLISKSITSNGNYSASADNADGYSSVSVNVPLPSNAYLLKSIENEQIATFTDGTDNFLKSLEVAIEPQQDLHGYDAPWVGGAGKNKLQTTATSQTVNGVTFMVNSDGTIKATGKATANVWFAVDATNWSTYSTLSNKGFSSSVILSGCPSGGSGNTYALGMRSGNSSNLLDAGNGVTITDLDTNTYYPAILIYNGYEIPSGGLLFKPMIRLATVSDSTFAPYSNICPISGWDECNITVADDLENPTTSNVYTIDLDGTIYGGKLDVVSGIVTPAPYYASYNGEALTGEWISDRDKYEVGTTPTIGAQVVNIGASDTPVSITPTIIKSLQGDNNFFASTGEVIKLQYWGEVS